MLRPLGIKSTTWGQGQKISKKSHMGDSTMPLYHYNMEHIMAVILSGPARHSPHCVQMSAHPPRRSTPVQCPPSCSPRSDSDSCSSRDPLPQCPSTRSESLVSAYRTTCRKEKEEKGRKRKEKEGNGREKRRGCRVNAWMNGYRLTVSLNHSIIHLHSYMNK